MRICVCNCNGSGWNVLLLGINVQLERQFHIYMTIDGRIRYMQIGNEFIFMFHVSYEVGPEKTVTVETILNLLRTDHEDDAKGSDKDIGVDAKDRDGSDKDMGVDAKDRDKADSIRLQKLVSF
ncbi:uncharacterized protein [Euphorbia lathyris]|uniref:uncharacterized protein isoform X2 n=1 Tax=Euphorbia lathyris TaxID=212925 RepID=UPI0033138DB8